jgi:hypothetical protein
MGYKIEYTKRVLHVIFSIIWPIVSDIYKNTNKIILIPEKYSILHLWGELEGGGTCRYP